GCGAVTAMGSLVDSGATTAASASSSVDGRVSSWIAMFVLLSGLATWTREPPWVRSRVSALDALEVRGIKKAGGLVWPSGFLSQAALPLLVRSRRAQISRVRGAERRAQPQLHGCGAGDACLCHLSETTPGMSSVAPGKDWRGHGAGGSIEPPVA